MMILPSRYRSISVKKTGASKRTRKAPSGKSPPRNRLGHTIEFWNNWSSALDREDVSKKTLPKPGHVAFETAGSVAGAGIGIAVGGPAGALIGAGTGPIAVYSARLVSAAAVRFWQRLKTSLSATKLTEQMYVHGIDELEERKSAFLKIIRVAAATIDDNHIDILAEAASQLVSADARRASAIGQVSEILSMLNVLHVKALTIISQYNLENPDSMGLTPDPLIEEFKNEEPLVRSIVRTLELHGLIVDNARFNPPAGKVYWQVTDLGKWLLTIQNIRTVNFSE